MNYLKVLLILLLPTTCFSQDFEGGLMLGISNYQGDLVPNAVELSESNLAFGLFLRYHLNEKWSLKGNAYFGKISGDDANFPERASRGFKFKSNITEIGVNAEWNILAENRFGTGGDYESYFTPYLFLGAALAISDPKPEGNGLPETNNYQKLSIAIPVGVGVKYVFGRSTIGLEGGFRPVFSDVLDGVSELGNPDKNDWYMFGGVMISFAFGSADYF